MNEVYCNMCRDSFVVDAKTRAHENNVVEVYFNCPHCGAYYVGDMLDDHGRKYRQEVRRLQKLIDAERLKNPQGSKREKQLVFQQNNLGKKIKARIDKLKKKYTKNSM